MRLFFIFLFSFISFVHGEDIFKLDKFPLLNDVLKRQKFILIFDDYKQQFAPDLKRFRLIEDLRISAGAQFHAKEWPMILEKLLPYAKKSKIYVVDLREEPHFFINEVSVSLCKKNTYVNEHKFIPFIDIPYDMMQIFEDRVVEGLSSKKKYTIFAVKEKENIKYTKHVLEKENIYTERMLVQGSGVHYLRLSITDHKRPTDEQVDAFLDLIKDMPKDAWIHFHCRGGVGRTSTLVLIVDMIKNKTKFSMEELIEKQKIQGGAKSLFKMNPLKKHKFLDAIKRKEFLSNFYLYVNDREGYGKQSWSSWIKNKKLQNVMCD
jgi:hypothetical protein